MPVADRVITESRKARMQVIARLRVGGMKLTEICGLVNLSYNGLWQIVILDEYKQVEAEIRKSFLGKLDGQLDVKANALNARFNEGVPHAVEALLESVKQRRDMRMAIEAAKELLDRDPERRFTKASRNANQGENAPQRVPDSILAGASIEATKVAAEVAKASGMPLAAPDRSVN